MSSLSMGQEYLNQISRELHKDHPGHTFTPQEVFDVASYLMNSVQLVYKPIPKADEAEYNGMLRTAEETQRRRLGTTK